MRNAWKDTYKITQNFLVSCLQDGAISHIPSVLKSLFSSIKTRKDIIYFVMVFG